jgi:hypothetical protein
MPEQTSNTIDEIMIEVYRSIYSALESRLHLIGSVIDAESRKEILAQQIYDKGDFYGNTGYVVETDDSGMTLRLGSNVKHEPFHSFVAYFLLFTSPYKNTSKRNQFLAYSPLSCRIAIRNHYGSDLQ